ALLLILRYLDEVEIRIAYVHRLHRSQGAGFRHRPFEDADSHRLQFLDDFRQRYRSDEAQVERTRNGDMRARNELLPPLMEVDLLAAELERQALLVRGTEFLERHAEHLDVEADARVLVARGQDDVVDVIDHVLFRSRRGLYSRTVSPR